MVQQQEMNQPWLSGRLVIPALIGAAIGAVLIAIFIFNTPEPRPEWHKTWWIRPMAIVPMATACGGMFFYFMYSLGAAGSWKKIVTTIIGLIGFVISLWMGTVLGLAGTYWH